MRVLWFSVTPSLFNPHSNGHNGGGWIASLEQIVRGNKDVELGIAFYFGNDHKVYDNEGVRYYTLPDDSRSMIAKALKPENENERINRYLEIIDDFKPELIQIFGSENDFGLICEHTDVPVVIHIQGSLPPYHNALYPIGMNRYDFILGRGLKWRRRLIGWRSEPAFRRNARREEKILRTCRYFMGRTDWDHNLVKLYNQSAVYFHCEEALRDSFIQSGRCWKQSSGQKLTIVSVISTPWYKGTDLILKTAKLLTENTDIDFEWKIYGVKDIKFFEYKYNIKAADVNVIPMGSVGKDELVDALCSASCYVHPSYIDNSPNSLCEAQYLGVPVLATNVGGISSLVKDGETGLLVPANDPYTLASLIMLIKNDTEFAGKLGRNARESALCRHDPRMIEATLVDVYNRILHQ